jgi:hypothetical protein
MTTNLPDDETTRLIQAFITAACHAIAWNYQGMYTVSHSPGEKMFPKPQPEGTYATTQAFSMLITAVEQARELGYPTPQIISPIPSNDWKIDLDQLPTMPIRQLPPSEIKLKETADS